MGIHKIRDVTATSLVKVRVAGWSQVCVNESLRTEFPLGFISIRGVGFFNFTLKSCVEINTF